MSDGAHAGGAASSPGRVQSVDRALRLLEEMADAGGIATLSDLADRTGLPMPTIHRLMATLRDAGYVRQEPSRRYALGAKLVGLGDSAGRLLGSWVRPTLAALVDEAGETANMAMLDGDRVVYLAQVPSKHSMRMFTEVGRRVDVHCTAVGKALVAGLPDEAVRGILRRSAMTKYTPNTLTTEDEFFAQLRQIRELGYAFDEAEQEMGVRCVAAATDSSAPVALSVSGPASRFSKERRDAVIPLLRKAVTRLADQ
ncbi:IclR family transcriptional regulator [Tomitella fengzijianii]|uniref:Glycerol operon regulatory protein n=1 Tax=Tomitella fengzijianii TaxID=2597660 RepID=A0A516X3K3_9ACTN|nr:IclR family transcriptional regulator [Tomitella fengzijianii]QDQ97634.1 IclR family transcriptional regulator [Tomitella fengzijianii]